MGKNFFDFFYYNYFFKTICTLAQIYLIYSVYYVCSIFSFLQSTETPCEDCKSLFQQLMLDNHQAITESVLRKMSDVREFLDEKVDRIEILEKRTETLVKQKEKMASDLEKLIVLVDTMKKENKTLQNAFNTFSL